MERHRIQNITIKTKKYAKQMTNSTLPMVHLFNEINR